MGRHSLPSRARLGSTVVAVALALAGTGLIGSWLVVQQRAPLARSAEASEAVPVVTTTASPSSEPAKGSQRPVVMDRSEPVELRIAAIGVTSTLQHLGQAADGSLEVPAPGPRYNDAAWYRHSPTPGELGPSVLLGHVDSTAEGPSVFFRLGELEPGDRVLVERADGSTARFTIDKVRRYSKDDFPTDLVYGDIDHAGLRILTCGGAFDESTGHYLDNVVVFASLDPATDRGIE